MKQMAFVVELDRCIGCKGCQVGCKMENNLPLGTNRARVKQIGPMGVYPDVLMYFLPTMCQQCENPSCVQVCPTGACYKRSEDGVVVIDQALCIGCKSCETACPYNCNTFNEELRIMDKCTICLHRRENGNDEPACVHNCCGGALHVGDINDPDSEVSRLIKDAGDKVYTLRDDGNHPSTRYILKKYQWQDLLPQECNETRRGKR